MESVLQTFGINWYLVAAQIVNFLIILYLLKRFVYKPIFAMLKKRSDMIEKSVEDAKMTKEELEKAENERKQIIKKAKDEAKRLLDDAKAESSEIVSNAQEKAKKQTAVTLSDAHEEIEREARLAERRIQSNIGKLIEKILRESLNEYLSPSEQKDIITKTMKRIPTID